MKKLSIIQPGAQRSLVTAVLHNLGLPADPTLDQLRLTPSGNVRPFLGRSLKTMKGDDVGVLTGILYGAPARSSGINTCAMHGECAGVCIKTAGQMTYPSSEHSRLLKTLYLHFYPEDALAQIRGECARLARKAAKKGMQGAVRLNGTTDRQWENDGSLLNDIISMGLVPYDYTKLDPNRRIKRSPPEYHLTYSFDPTSPIPGGSLSVARSYLSAGGNVAIVVNAIGGTTANHAKEAQAALLSRGSWETFPVISGDDTDVRYRDPAGHVVVLHAKGAAIRSDSPFIQRIRT